MPHITRLAFAPAARELVREVDYTLATLARSLLGQARSEVAPAELPARYESAQGLRQLLLLGESDAWLALGLAFTLSGGGGGRLWRSGLHWRTGWQWRADSTEVTRNHYTG